MKITMQYDTRVRKVGEYEVRVRHTGGRTISEIRVYKNWDIREENCTYVKLGICDVIKVNFYSITKNANAINSTFDRIIENAENILKEEL